MKNGTSPTLKGYFPIVIAITGHRDICRADIPLVKKIVVEVLRDLQKRYPNTRIQLLSGLAEGADRIAAQAVEQVALDFGGVELVPVPPMEDVEYEKDFPDSVLEYRGYIERWQGHLRFPEFFKYITPITKTRRDEQYQKLGQYLVFNSHFLLAMMEHGKGEVPKKGGTADVVLLANNDLPQKLFFGLNLSSKPKSVPLIFRVRRKADSKILHRNDTKNQEQNISQRITKALADPIKPYKNLHTLKNELDKIDQLNWQALEMQRSDSAKLNRSKADLFGEFTKQIEEECQKDESLKHLVNIYAFFDCLALKNQSKRVWLVSGLLLTAVIALALRELYAGPYPEFLVGIISVILVLVVMTCHAFYFSENIPMTSSRNHSNDKERMNPERKYFQYRMAAEMTRIQIFWYLAGISQLITEKYSALQLDELSGINLALNGVFNSILDKKEKVSSSSEKLKIIKARWLEDQNNFFKKKEKKQRKLSTNLNRISNTLSFTGLLLFLVPVLLLKYKTLPLVIHYKILISKAAPWLPLWFSAQWWIWFSALSFIVAAAIKIFSEIMAYEKQYLQYAKMRDMYERSLLIFDEAILSEDKEWSSACLKAVGAEALSDNVGWKSLHDSRKFDPM